MKIYKNFQLSYQRYLENLFYIIIFLLPFSGFFTIWLSSLIGYELLIRAWAETAILLISIVLLLSRKINVNDIRKLLKDKLALFIILYVGFVCLYSLIFFVLNSKLTRANVIGLVIDTRYFIFFIVTYLLFSKKISSRPHEKIMIKSISIPGLVVGSVALLQAYLLPKDILKYFGFNPPKFNPVLTIDGNDAFVRVRSLLRGPNELGAYLITPIITSIKILKDSVRKKTSLIILSICIFALILSYSRSAWIGLTFAVLIYFSRDVLNIVRSLFNSTKGKLLVVLISLSLMLSGAVFINSNVFKILILHDDANNQIEGSTTVRINVFDDVLKDTLDHPFGDGPGTSGPASVYGDYSRIPDNYYVQIAQQYGFIGLALFSGIIYYFIKKLLVLKNSWAKVVLCIFIGVSISNLFLHNWADSTLSMMFWGLSGWVIALSKQRKLS